MNEKLLSLYEKYWGRTVEKLNRINENIENLSKKGTNPLLLKINNQEYWDSAMAKIMFFGQETNGWDGLPTENAKKIFDKYGTHFCNEKLSLNGAKQFGNGIRRVKNELQTQGITSSFVWNNTLKIGKYSEVGKPAPNITDAEIELFDVTISEIEIINPNIIIFACGPNYDDVLRRKFKDSIIEPIKGYPIRELAKVKSDFLPELTFRTYHPRYLFMKKIYIFQALNEAIVDALKK